MKKSGTKKWLGLFLAFAVAVTTVFSPASFSYAAGEEGSNEGEVAVQDASPIGVSSDVGQYAAVSSSGSTWDRDENTINDVNWEPVGNNGAQTDGYVPNYFGWGNYAMAPSEEGYYVQYDWMEVITTEQMALYWWDDGNWENGTDNGGGLGAPGTLKILYKDPTDTSEWKEAEMTTNFSEARKVGQYNVIDFKEISATSIRLEMSISETRWGIGICRWLVAGTRKQLSDEQIYMVDQDRLTLPKRAEADFELPATTASGKALTWESNDTSVIKVGGNIAKITKGSSEKTVKLTAKLNGKVFKEFPVIVEKRPLLQDATVSLPVSTAFWWGVETLINGELNVANSAAEAEGSNIVQLNFARKLSLTGTTVYWHAIPGGQDDGFDYYAPLPTGVTFQYLKNEVSPDDASSWEDIELTANPTFTDDEGDTYNFKNEVNTTKLRLVADLGIRSTGEKGGLSILEWEIFGEEYIDQTDIIAADAVREKIEALGTPAHTDEFKAKLNEARSMYDGLSATQKGLLEDVYKILTDAEDAYANMEAADAVIKAIDAILEGNTTADGKLNITEANKAQIQEKVNTARTAYGELKNDAQRNLVKNYSVLTNAEALLKDFGRSDAEILADLVVEINQIGNADDMTPANMEDYKDEIESAEARRDALKDQTLVTGATGNTKTALDKLVALRTKYNSLKANLDAAQPVIDAINAIGTPLAATEECYARFQTAKAQYDALEADAEALVSNKSILDEAVAYFSEKTIVTAMTIKEPTSKTLKVGDKFKLEATTTPAEAAVTWKSNNADVVKVSETTGDVEALKEGTATITATAGDNKKTATITFTVEAETVEVTALTVSPTSKTMKISEKVTLTATTTPANQKVTWTSSAPTIAKVSETTGEVEALAKGTATITATAGSNNKTATCEITVEEKEDDPTPTADVTLPDTALEVGGVADIKVQYSAAIESKLQTLQNCYIVATGSQDKQNAVTSDVIELISWGMTPEYGIADPHANITIRGLKAGTAYIQVVINADNESGPAVNPIYATAKITVTGDEPTKVSIEDAEVTVPDCTYNKKAQTPEVTVKVGDNTLVKGTDYTVSYENNTNAGTAKAVINAVEGSNYTGQTEKNFTINKASAKITAKNITKIIGEKNFSFGAKVDSKGTLSYKSKSTKVIKVVKGKAQIVSTGTAKITITAAATANYKSATKTITIKVNKPNKVTLSKVESKKSGQLKVTWKKDAKATGYKVMYSTDKKFKNKKVTKTVTVKKNKTVSTTIKKLKKGKKYYVKVCSYVKVGKKEYLGAYSKVKNVKIKK